MTLREANKHIESAENAIQRISTELMYLDSRRMDPKNQHYQRLLEAMKSYHEIIKYVKELKENGKCISFLYTE